MNRRPDAAGLADREARWEAATRFDVNLVVEAGAGRGALAIAVRAAEPRCAGALHWVMVERSATLRASQQEHLELTDGAPTGTGPWFSSAPDLPTGPVTGAVVVSTPQQIALADARKGVAMFQQEAIQVPVLGILENMAYFTPEELPDNKYYIFGQHGARNLAEDMEIPFLGEIPLVQGIREAADVGRPAALQTDTLAAAAFEEATRNMVREVVRRNKNLPPTEAIKITTMAGCSAVNKK